MLFVSEPKNADAIRTFCRQFTEGFRVEYKRELSKSVREKIPAIVSSFADSLGGVLIIGVQTDNGVPTEPIDGFLPPEKEELHLTIENICLTGTNPPVLPRTTLVPSDVQGCVFLVVEVEESWEAPHAIENSKTVYVRTGDASNPYDHAEVDLIISLVKRREEPLRLRDRLAARFRKLAPLSVGDLDPYTEVLITPLFPRRPLCSTDELWNWAWTNPHSLGILTAGDYLRRVDSGVADIIPRKFAGASKYGAILVRQDFQPGTWQQGPGVSRQYLNFTDALTPIVESILCAARFYDAFGYRGNIDIEISLHNMDNRIVQFMPVGGASFLKPEDFQCLEGEVGAQRTASAETLSTNREEIVTELSSQLCWSFWQSHHRFPAEKLASNIKKFLQSNYNSL